MMMTRFSKYDMRKLSALCEDRKREEEKLRDSADGEATHLERCLSHREAEYMKALSAKLLAVAESNARRVEITI